ncbi:MAG: CsgG/HfaB family protein, partial [bacterium]|nr:CsgG/HfaB family protein [bacterium]
VSVKWGGVGVGPEINSVFESALADTGRFRTVSREKIKNVLAEQDLAIAGRVRQSTAVKTGEITGSDLMVIAKITGFDPGDSGIGAAVGAVGRAVGGWIGALGIVAGGIKTSSLVMDVQVVDVRTSEIVVSTTVEGNSMDWSAGGAFVGRSLGVGIAGWKNTPMEKNLRVVVEKAAGEISGRLPQEYFKH